MTTVTVQALDALVRFTAPEPIGQLFAAAFADLLADGEPLCAVTSQIVWREEGADRWHVSLGQGGSIAPADAASGLAESIIEINQQAARSVAADHHVLHAGVFEVDGRAVAVTGASGAGKSTLVAAAVLRGHGFVADEVCAVEPTSVRVRPYHRPIGLRAAGAAAIGVPIPEHRSLPYTEVYPWRAGGNGRLAGPAPLRLIALAERRPGPTQVVAVGEADALVRLTNLALGTDAVERVMFRRLSRLVREVPMVVIGYEDSLAAVDALAERVARAVVG